MAALRDNRVDMLVNQGDGTYDNFLARSVAHYDRIPMQQAIIPAKQQ